MSDTLSPADACVATLHSWAQAHHLDAYLFGSLLTAPLQFDGERSDVDLVIVTASDATSAEDRLAFAQKLRPLIEDLEIQLMRTLRRESAKSAITSVLLVTPKEIADNVHKSGVRDFFSTNAFLRLGAEGAEPIMLADRMGESSEVAAAVQAERNEFLRCSPNGAVAPEPFDGPDNLPKRLLRFAAIAASIDTKTKDTNVDNGLGFLITLLSQRRGVPVGAAANEVVLRRCNGPKGQRPAIAPDTLLYIWELILDRPASEPNPATVLDSERKTSSPSLDLLRRLTTALGTADPQALLHVLPPDVVPGHVPASLLPTVIDACWRLRNPVELLRWGQDISHASGLLGTEEASVLRLLSWALWETGSREKASEILTKRINNVVDPGERARWADQKATFIRFMSPKDWMVAETDYQQSLALRERNDHLGYAMTLQNLAFLYLEQGELAQAYRFMRRIADRGRSVSYEGANVSFLIGTLGMAWLDLIDGHPTRNARARELLRQLGLHFKMQRFGNPREFRLIAKALELLWDFRRGYDRQPSNDLSEFFWSRLVLEQLLVARGKPVETAVDDLRELFPRPRIVPESLPMLLTLLLGSADVARNQNTAVANLDATWPLSAIAAVSRGSTLGAIQALELMLRLYEAICIAIAGTPPKGQLKSSASIVNTLRTLSSDVPSLLAEEMLRVAAIAEEGIPARNRIVHAATQPGDEQLIATTMSLAIEEAALVRQSQWTASNPVEGKCGDISFSAASFCAVEDGSIVMTLGGTKLSTNGIISQQPKRE